eukprot:3347729-Prymnesium_polylepis.1
MFTLEAGAHEVDAISGSVDWTPRPSDDVNDEWKDGPHGNHKWRQQAGERITTLKLRSTDLIPGVQNDIDDLIRAAPRRQDSAPPSPP